VGWACVFDERDDMETQFQWRNLLEGGHLDDQEEGRRIALNWIIWK
jgi:hypothetical protein